MKRPLKVVNGTLLGLFALAVVGAAIGGGLGGALPASIWLVLPYLTMRAADRPQGSLYSWAFGLNVFAVFAFGASALAVFLNTGADAKSAGIAFLVVVFTAPFIWNLYALRRAKQAATEFELLPNDAPNTWGSSAEELPVNVEPPPSRSRNYLLRHWRGELSLPVSYWVNGSFIGVGMLVLFLVMGEVAKSWELRSAAVLMLALMTLLILTTAWSIVGILRSAGQHVSRGGSSGWATAAQVMTVLGALSFVGRLGTQIGPQMGEFASIAFNYDAIQKVNATLAADGRSIALHGTFGTGSFEYVQQIMSAAPGVHMIVLDSEGGRLREAEQLAELIRERELDTYVEGQCLSACTYLFLAGKDRAATPNAKIGFHRPSFAGTNDYEAGLGEMLSYYRRAGISEPFLDRIRNTKSDEMWHPTRDELIDNGVLTRVSLGGETATLSSKVRSRSELELAYRSLPLMRAMENRFPGTLEQALDAAWAQHESGASDAQISAAARAIISEIYPKLLATADDAGLDGFLTLMVRQMTAARELGPKACSLYLDSKLDVTKVFSPELITEETNWGLAQLEAQPTLRKPVPQAMFERALEPLTNVLDQSVLEVVAAPEKFINDPERRCDSMLAFYAAIVEQPQSARAILMRGMFQSGE